MATTQSINQKFKNQGQTIDRVLTVATGAGLLPEGSLVGIDSNGQAIKADTTHPVAGVAVHSKNAGWQITVYFNHVISFSLPGVVLSDMGSTAYVADNNTLTLTPNTGIIGPIVSVDTVNSKALVHATLYQVNGLVDSVFGRTGDVVAVAGDYDASQVDNDSGVAGAYVDDALDNLAASIPAVHVSSVFTRTGAVVAAASDYDASQVDNDSTYVSGTYVDSALDQLHNAETYITKAVNYPAVAGDNAIGVDTSAGARTITLPAASTNAGVRIRISKITSDINSVIVATTGGDTVGFQSQWNLTAQGDSLTAISDGTSEWLLFTERHASDWKFFKLDPNANLGNHRVRSLASTGNINMEFRIPDNFLSLISLVIEGNPSAGAAGSGKDIDLFSDYGGLGENYAAHSESDTTTVYDFTGLTDAFVDIDLSGVFTSISAGDRCGFNIDHNGVGGAIRYTGITITYLKKG